MKNNSTKYLKISMFGEFSIKNEHHSLTASKQSGLTSFLLLGYLFSNKGNDITSDMLIDVLWPEGESNNPQGALRTLLHRTKKLLQPFFPGEDVELLTKNNNIYTWNPDIRLYIDIFEFEKSAHRAFREPDQTKQFELLEKANALYKGDFLPMFSHHSWVMFRNNYYGNLFIKTVNLICYHLSQEKEYEKTLELCNKALDYSPSTDETLHKQKIFTLLNLGRAQTALEYYYSLLALFNNSYGLDITESMADVYEAILSSMPNQFQTLSSLDETLRSRKVVSGSFYCNFDIFQNIYQINLRSARRTRSRYYLVLLTLNESDERSIITEDLKEEMDILHTIMQKKLRSNDVYTKSSICQYSLIINSPNEGGAEVIRHRIEDSYLKKRKHPNIELHVDFKEIV
ncbi:DNA-binding SARP family transcriptional activator [Aequitasia blattaphilus]|uniref:Bacterial transcriptional activator domain-containing protein n=1 Tax=Aequitasia blattaphilus TaxID=2949332 RepID=A0ABT1E7J1_9FIRM|nr:BTAD domain-containing putative transcriptional regulator [Aequitasia blattaphilus]MCP1101795.1 hypothetical protein [Aequitasia blattaphilus]MCR8614435.1 hypothetical protein [Aequitasia blattaphilus]